VLLNFCQIGKPAVRRSRICFTVLTVYERLSIDTASPAGLGSQTTIGYDIVPRAYPATDVLAVTMAEAMSEIREVLRRQEAARPIGLTAINFGFSPSFSVAVVCILESTAAPLPTQLVVGGEVPVVVLHGSFEDLAGIDVGQGDTSSIALDAADLVNAGSTGFDLRERLGKIRKLPQPIRAAELPGPVMHGSSIGLAIGMENKGSASVYLTPLTSRNGFDAERSYLLTAAHVVKRDELPADFTLRLDDGVENLENLAITTPGRLDTLAILYSAHRISPIVVESMVRAAQTACGTVKCGRIGVDDAGYREDWALVELKEPYQGSNGVWWDLQEFLVWRQKDAGGDSAEAFNGEIVACSDPEPGDDKTWYKEGATSGWASGGLSTTHVDLFLKGGTMPVNPGSVEKGYVHGIEARLQLFFPKRPANSMAEKGDSGAGLYGLSDDTKNFVFGGLVVSLFCPAATKGGDQQELVMVVPQSRVFAQIEKCTGVKWQLA
jgi:hypothetical protein